MGELARTLVSLSGPDSVHGIIPRALVGFEASDRVDGGGTGVGEDKAGEGREEVPDEQVYGKTTVVSSMHTRKQLMTQLVLAGGPGSGFIALPGGYGTLEELAEVVTWNQLGIHSRGVVVWDVAGFWAPLREWVEGSVEAGFISERNKGIVRWAGDAEGCLRELVEYRVSGGVFDLRWEET